MACPYESWPCGASSPYIELSMGETYELALFNRLEGPGLCWYRFGVDEMIDESELDVSNTKYMQVYVNSLSSAYMYIAGGLSEAAIQEEEVTIVSPERYEYNFTQPPTQYFFITLKPLYAARPQDISANITFRYYTYDHGCAEFRSWNGTACVDNYTWYCDSLTEAAREEQGIDDLIVVYNGSACVATVIVSETREQVVIVERDVVVEVIRVEEVEPESESSSSESDTDDTDLTSDQNDSKA